MNIKKDLKIALTYIGAIIGAGFASGRELMSFFGNFGSKGLLGSFLSGIFFALLGYLIISLVNKLKVDNYGFLIKALFPKSISPFFDLLITLFLWIGLGVMMAGSGELLFNQFNFKACFAFALTAFALYLPLALGKNGLIEANTFLIPFLIVLAIFSSLLYLYNPQACAQEKVFFIDLVPNWWLGSLNYVSYNIILATVVLASIREFGQKISPISGLIGGMVLGILAFLMTKGMLCLPLNLQNSEMPMLELTAILHKGLGKLYGLGLWVALFTTAMANVHALGKRSPIPYPQAIILIIISSLVFLPWKFSLLISLLYPVLGYLGLPLIIAMIINLLKTKVP